MSYEAAHAQRFLTTAETLLAQQIFDERPDAFVEEFTAEVLMPNRKRISKAIGASRITEIERKLGRGSYPRALAIGLLEVLERGKDRRAIKH